MSEIKLINKIKNPTTRWSDSIKLKSETNGSK